MLARTKNTDRRLIAFLSRGNEMITEILGIQKNVALRGKDTSYVSIVLIIKHVVR